MRFSIFFIWTGVVTLFGIFYYFFTSRFSALFFTPTQKPVRGIFDHIYYSFITATSTGFGDIIPLGLFKIISIIEVIFGLLLLAFVTSKLISIKQDVILNEIYEISFNERISRIRSSLLLFRQNISRTIHKIDDESIRKREINDIYIHIHSLEEVLGQVPFLIGRKEKKHFTKAIDSVNAELLFNSIINSFKRLHELITILDLNQLEWRRDVVINLIKKCVRLNESLFERLKELKNLSEDRVKDLTSRNQKWIKFIEEKINDGNKQVSNN